MLQSEAAPDQLITLLGSDLANQVDNYIFKITITIAQLCGYCISERNCLISLLVGFETDLQLTL